MNKKEKKCIQDAYEEILNEGMFDRFKARVAGATQTVKGVANNVKEAGRGLVGGKPDMQPVKSMANVVKKDSIIKSVAKDTLNDFIKLNLIEVDKSDENAIRGLEISLEKALKEFIKDPNLAFRKKGTFERD
jgi:hypothetical protein